MTKRQTQVVEHEAIRRLARRSAGAPAISRVPVVPGVPGAASAGLPGSGAPPKKKRVTRCRPVFEHAGTSAETSADVIRISTACRLATELPLERLPSAHVRRVQALPRCVRIRRLYLAFRPDRGPEQLRRSRSIATAQIKLMQRRQEARPLAGDTGYAAHVVSARTRGQPTNATHAP